MSAAAVAAQIAELDALSRTRALTDRESRTLQRMLTVERRYRRPRAPVKAETAAAYDPIGKRIDAALTVLQRAGRTVRHIYLSTTDMSAAQAAELLQPGEVRFRGKPSDGLLYRGHSVRWCKGRCSLIYDGNGVGHTIAVRAAR